jgi:hypothetical protein
MLDDREQQELDLIEQRLRDDTRFDDTRFSASFTGARKLPFHRRRRIAWAGIAFGLVTALCGLAAAEAGLVAQGFLVACVGYTWWRWWVKPAAAEPTGSGVRRQRPRRPTRPGS